MAEYPHILAANLLQDADSTSFTDGSGVALTQDSVYRLTHLTDRSRQSYWKGDSSTAEQRVIWDLGSAQEVDCFVLDKNFTLTGSVTVYFDYSSNNSSYTNATSISSPDSDVIYWKTFSSQTKRYWRLRITGLTAAPQVYNVWGGLRLQFTKAPAGEYDPYEEEVVGDSSEGKAGAYQRTSRFYRRVVRAEFRNLSSSEFTPVDSWWSQAGRDQKNWWWLALPTSYSNSPTDSDYFPVFVNCEGAARRFSYNTSVSSSYRNGTIEGHEVL